MRNGQNFKDSKCFIELYCIRKLWERPANMLTKRRFTIFALAFMSVFFIFSAKLAFAQQATSEVTISISPSVADTTIRNGDPNANFANLTFIEAESTLQFGFIKFDLSSIPSGATVVSAKLIMFDTEGQGGNQTISVSRVDSNWAENTLIWNSAVTLESPTASLNYNPSDTGYHTWDVTGDVQAFLSGTPNYGWCVKISDGWVTFASKEGLTDMLPKLDVTIQATPTPTPTPAQSQSPAPTQTPVESQIPQQTQTPEPSPTPAQTQYEWVPYVVAVPAIIGGVAAVTYVIKYRSMPKPGTGTSPAPGTSGTTTSPATKTDNSATLAKLKVELVQKQAYIAGLKNQLAQDQQTKQFAELRLSKDREEFMELERDLIAKGASQAEIALFSKTWTAEHQTQEDMFWSQITQAEFQITRLQNTIQTTEKEIQQLQAQIALLQTP